MPAEVRSTGKMDTAVIPNSLDAMSTATKRTYIAELLHRVRTQRVANFPSPSQRPSNEVEPYQLARTFHSNNFNMIEGTVI